MNAWFTGVILVLALYGLSSLLVGVVCFLFRMKREKVDYILYTADSEQRLEEELRDIRRESFLSGTDYQVFLLDEGSRDDTQAIFERFEAVHFFASSYEGLQLNSAGAIPIREESRKVWVDLRSHQ